MLIQHNPQGNTLWFAVGTCSSADVANLFRGDDEFAPRILGTELRSGDPIRYQPVGEAPTATRSSRFSLLEVDLEAADQLVKNKNGLDNSFSGKWMIPKSAQ